MTENLISGDGPHTWGTAYGAWGDVLCSLGYFQKRVGEGGVIYFGHQVGMKQFLEAQPFITEVRTASAPPGFDWSRFVENEDVPLEKRTFDGLPIITGGSGVPPNEVVRCHLDYELKREPIRQWWGARLPAEVEEWAKGMRAKLPSQFRLFQPYSLNSNGYNRHWRGWGDLMRRMLSHSAVPMVMTGHGLPTDLWGHRPPPQPGFIDLTEQLPSMMHAFALAQMSIGVVTTSNSLAHWCQIQSVPAVVVCNRTSSQPGYFFRRMQECPTLTNFDWDASVADVLSAIHARIGGGA
jgi:hypothetical protein